VFDERRKKKEERRKKKEEIVWKLNEFLIEN
jgi:hypothetical protein